MRVIGPSSAAFDIVAEAANYALDRTKTNTLYSAANWFAALRPAA